MSAADKKVSRAAKRNSGAGSRPDARTERWRAHREQVRADFVDAALRALAEHGPDVSMDDIARAAGCAKPKLYRHFDDKTDLYLAILERVQTRLFDRVLDRVNLLDDSVADLLCVGIAEYVAEVEERPEVFRFLVHGRMAQQTDQPERALEVSQRSALLVARIVEEQLEGQLVDTGSLELTTYAIFGAVGSATEWYLGANRSRDEHMTAERFAEHVTTIATAVLDSVAQLNKVAVDVRKPAHLAFAMV
ncbi:TetR/AcrR family transcriptional regulator [Nocardia uniformis]|uniref:TetR/AcrR family transcriptional regulator n=1 Tax=Nocardia uniformis TaxID=53432 RepID=A0A849BYF8_9NOCA|nr:TetR/AcrR family transcriptional regulator [Nocardia uniformis]NNH68707.1 TetR/AcrR family transcriptional regulator [Nocardia uniformis]